MERWFHPRSSNPPVSETPVPATNPEWSTSSRWGGVSTELRGSRIRMKSARVKVDQITETGAKILATACENCHTQLSNLNDHYQMGVEVRFLSSMIADALVKMR